MTRAVDGLQPLKGKQALASGPDAHVWLSASAGTGKTHVLTARVYRLLLKGVSPEHILCLTFTKAGAAEMAERIHGRLAAWVQMDDVALFQDLEALGEPSGPEARERARRLFADVLEATGGGLRIQTIHSFCQQLLSAFPIEADLVPGFRPLDDREQGVLARQALADLVVRAEVAGDEALMDALQALSLRLGEAGAESFLMRAAGNHAALDALPGDIRLWLGETLGLPPGDIDAVIADQCSDNAFDIASLARIAAANAAWGTATGLGFADRIAAWRSADDIVRAATLPELAGVFLTGKGEERKASAKLIGIEPDYVELAARLGRRCAEMMALREQAAYADLLAQALHAGRAYALGYAEAKRASGAVDFNDLIQRAVELLLEGGMAEWIRYKLDQRTDHILVDEAQDTNNAQWQIVAALAAEFFAGEGARGTALRTIFTVGDFKQAIFGFQGTSPMAFLAAKLSFRAKAQNSDHIFHDLSLNDSFRSMPAVLEAVDATMEGITDVQLGLAEPLEPHHGVNQHPGEVTLWKPVVAQVAADDEDAETPEDWLADQQRALAAKIARQIREWIDNGVMLESKGRPITAGDVMILVRSRGDLARLIVARLYEENVPVAGIDRLRLNAPLAVRDLLAALRFAVQPEDDLNLACLLTSPLVGWTQDELYARAFGRTEGLWRHLRGTLDDDALAPLRGLLSVADLMTPYRYLEHILSGPLQGRRRLLARLGTEARDPIEELLNAAIAFEGEGDASLQRFIDWFDRGNVDIVRDAAGQAGAVRLLTVHGAKGLQAPVVILADAARDPDAGNRRDVVEWEGLPIVPPRKAERVGSIGEAVEARAREEREEHWRLLYVAMTRAEEKLIVTGSLPARAKGIVAQESWYAAVERGLSALGATWIEDPVWGGACTWAGQEVLPPRKAKAADKVASALVDVPNWLYRAAPVEARPPRPLAPSAPAEDDTADPPPSPAMRAAAERGRCLHALFERLPDIPPAQRAAAAERWLERSAAIADPSARADLIEQALRVIDDAAFATLFAPGGLAEAPIAAVVGEAVVAGTVDRLRVEQDRVLFVDYKTGRRVPEAATDAPPAHLRQMAAYAAALAVIFPGRRVEAALLYTAGPKMLTVPADLLDRHKPGFAAAQHNL